MRLAQRRDGDGPPAVILHGLFGSARNWATIARALADGHEIHAVDLRNHGDSPWADAMSYAEMAADIRDLIAAEALDRPVAIGHSMGGKVAMTLALLHPEAVAGLCVIDVAPAPYPLRQAGVVGALRDLDLARIGSRAEADAALSQAIPEAPVRAFLVRNLVAAEGGYRWRINVAAIDACMADIAGFPVAPGERSYDGPALFLYGSESDYVQSAHHAAIRALFPAAEIAAIEGAGHWVHVDRADDLVARLRAFLTRVQG